MYIAECTYYNVHDALVVAIPVEGVRVLFAVYQDPLPSQLLDLEVDLVDMGVLGCKERANVQRKLLRIENVWRHFRQVYQKRVNWAQGLVDRSSTHST